VLRRSVGLGDRKLAREGLAVYEGLQPLTGRLFAVSGCGLAVLGCVRALLGTVHALLRIVLAMRGGANDDVSAGDADVVLVQGGGVVACHIARLGGVVSRPCRDVTRACDLVAGVGGGQTRLGDAVALASGPAPLACCSVTDIVAERVRLGVHSGAEVTIAGGRIAIGSKLVRVGARSVAVRAFPVGV
jgi:hypothetical protein